ncbi:MAG: citrate lyase holo-[Firmicutes bacterium]|nr:citrate lyase holo-[acyl-carrier protein] synthase [Bacillota bacterium]
MAEHLTNTSQLTLMELLDSRENRVRHQQELLAEYGGSLISMTLNIPGPVKDSPEYRKALRRGMEELKEKIASVTEPEGLLHEEIRDLITGPEGYLCISKEALSPMELKKAAVEVEEASPLGRLFDIDVLTAEGGISRAALGAPPRRCLICPRDAKACARSRAHSMDELLARVAEIITETVI